MATYTPNYNLKKPADSDSYDIADANGNMDIIDGALNTLNNQIVTQTVANPVTFNTTSTTSTSRVSSLSKCANVISLHIEVNMVNGSGWGVVGVVNSAYKPKHETYITVSNLSASTIKTAYIDTDGNIRIFSPDASTYYFDITYII